MLQIPNRSSRRIFQGINGKLTGATMTPHAAEQMPQPQHGALIYNSSVTRCNHLQADVTERQPDMCATASSVITRKPSLTRVIAKTGLDWSTSHFIVSFKCGFSFVFHLGLRCLMLSYRMSPNLFVCFVIKTLISSPTLWEFPQRSVWKEFPLSRSRR